MSWFALGCVGPDPSYKETLYTHNGFAHDKSSLALLPTSLRRIYMVVPWKGGLKGIRSIISGRRKS